LPSAVERDDLILLITAAMTIRYLFKADNYWGVEHFLIGLQQDG